MIGYRHKYGSHLKGTPHPVTLDGITLHFDEEGMLWEPKPHEVEIMTRDYLRRSRFELVRAGELGDHVTGEAETAQPVRGRRRRKRGEEGAGNGAPVNTEESSE